ncbi:MAG: peptide deformylase [Puniceicoccales bacterium]|jgi:peptide deformylase|nr:peptide deformylase [Puniceicoccales bacterium]
MAGTAMIVQPPPLEYAIPRATGNGKTAFAVLASPEVQAFLAQPLAKAIQKIAHVPGMGSPALRAPNARVEDFSDPNLPALAEGMVRAIEELHGIGLTACQVGINVAVFAVDLGACVEIGRRRGGDSVCKKLTLDGRSLLRGASPGVALFFNPTMRCGGREVRAEEGCLSIPSPTDPGKSLEVKLWRPSDATLSYQDLAGAWHVLDADGWPARCLQHEYDHVQGRLITDRDPRWRDRIFPLPGEGELASSEPDRR